MAASSAMFAPYRSVGLVCDGAQAALYALGAEAFFVAPAQRCFQVYNLDHLSLALVSRPLAHPITHVACYKDHTFAATRAGIFAFIKGTAVRRMGWGAGGGAVTHMLVLGGHLLTLHADNALRVWDAKRAVQVESDAVAADGLLADAGLALLVCTVVLPAHAGRATCLLHPDAYVNKVAVGTAAGSVLIVNVRTGALVYECAVAPGVAVTCLAQSGAADVVGVGLADGGVAVRNLRADEDVCRFTHAAADRPLAGGAVTALSFSGPGGMAAGGDAPVLATATDSGALALWSLRDRALLALVPAAHDAAIVSASWLPHRAACLLTSGSDNALRVWQVDAGDGVPRLLRARTGHTAPPRLIRYYGGASLTSLASGASATACELVSAGGGDRSLRALHTALAQQCCELSQGPLLSRARELRVHPNALRLPPVVALAASDRRHAQWADVVTAHAGEGRAYLWSWERKRLEDVALQLPARGGGGGVAGSETVASVCLSACGSFALLGGSQGTVAKFNVQSGAARGTFPKDAVAAATAAAAGVATSGVRRPAAHDAGDIGAGGGGADIGKGARPLHRLSLIDSVDSSLMRVMGMLPPALQLQQAQARAAAARARAGPAATAAADAAAAADPPGHAAAVVGVGVDALNRGCVSVDAGGRMLFWDFVTHARVGALQLPGGAARLVLHGDSGLAAVACPEDFSVLVVDVSARRVVRRAVGHAGAVTDMAFSPDGRWLVTAAQDACLRVWDLPTGRCVDWLRFAAAAVSVAFSPTSEFLATAHIGGVGVCLWANRAHFGAAAAQGGGGSGAGPRRPVFMDLPLQAPEEGGGEGGESEAAAVAQSEAEAPCAAAGRKRRRPRAAEADGSEDCGTVEETPAPAARPGCSITLSGVPLAHWQSLTRLDTIAARNKPALPPKAPAAAPFFLPTTTATTAAGLAPAFVFPSQSAAGETAAGKHSSGEEEEGGRQGRILHTRGARVARSGLANLLRAFRRRSAAAAAAAPTAAAPEAAAAAVLRHLAGLTPSGVDAEFRSLCLGREDGEGVALLACALRYLTHQTRAGAAFDLTQAHLQLFLQLYQDVIGESPRLRAAVAALRVGHEAHAATLSSLVDHSLCLLSSLLGQ